MAITRTAALPRTTKPGMSLPIRYVKVPLPLWSEATYPFTGAQYHFRMPNPTGEVWGKGKLVGIQYGFTKQDADYYAKHPKLPWYDHNGMPKAEGTLPITYQHTGGYKGVFQVDPLTLKVPKGKNLVFKLVYETYNGRDPNKTTGKKQTQKLFLQVGQP